MTADMPDAVIVAREALAKKYDETGWHDQAAYIRDAGNLDTDPLKFAILGARAMQDAMAGRVRVKALEWVEPTKLTNGCWSAECELGVFSVAFDDGWHAELNDGRDWEWEPEMDPRSYEGPDAAQRACQAYRDARILSALEPAGAQEGAPDLVPVTITNSKTGETRQAYIDRSRGVVLERDAIAAEAERDALRAEVEALRAYIADAPPADVAGLQAEVERKDKALREAGEAIAEYFRYLNGGEMRGSYDGKPEREGLRKAGYAVSRALAPAKAGG